jgi:hypothetical protein
MPSDTFFYVRAAPAAAHELGIPFIVAQKETTISEHTMRMHAESVRCHAPPLADLMTVCSERHKEFWLRAGGDPERIVVTGQPRFDFYLMPHRWPTRSGSDPPTVLFLSYQADAYHPSEGAAGEVWDQLHRQTEAGLHVLAQRGWRVLIKPHPQQSRGDVQAWRTRAGALWGKQMLLVDADADVRALIVTADVTVGFQTTALLEAMLAGRPAAYTGWDERAAAIGPDLIPFHEWDDALAVVRSPEALADTVDGLRGKQFDSEALQRRRAIAEHYLGPLDGHASDRTLGLVRRAITTWTEGRSPEQLALRERLCARSRPVALSMRGRAGLRIARRRVGALLSR